MGRAIWLERILGLIASIWTFLAPIVPGTVAAIAIGAASTGVDWLNQFGAFGWLSSGLLAFAIMTGAMALMARGRLWRVEALNRSRLSGDSSPFDPMQSIFQNKRIRIIDLVNPYDQVVLNKKFINCEIIGPANLFVVFANAKFQRNHFEQCDSVEIRDSARPQNAIGFAGCDFEACRFFKVTMLFQSESREAADQLIDGMNWLTQVEEPQLAIEDQTETGKGLGAALRRLVGRDGK